MEEKRPNTQLRRERELRGWSQKVLAEHIGTNEQTVTRWESGNHKPSKYFQAQLCQLFGKSAEELGFMVHTTAKEEARPEEASTIEGKDMDRRDFLRVVGTSVLAPTAQSMFDVEPWERFSKVLQQPSRLDKTTLDHLELLVKNTWQLIPDVTGVVSYELRDYTLSHLLNITELLEGSLTDNGRKKLTSLGAGFSLIAASMSSNLRDFKKALSYYHVSIEAAHEAGNDPLEAVGLASLAIRLTHLNHAKEALPMIQQARQLAQNATLTTRTWLAAVEAEVQANLKDYTACFKALEYAEYVPKQYSSDEDPYLTTFGPSLLAGYKGICHMQFNEPEAAYQVLLDALTHLTVPSISRRCYILTDLASTCLKRNEVTEACDYAHQSLVLTNQAKSPALWQRMNTIHQQLDPWKDTKEVKELDEQLQALR